MPTDRSATDYHRVFFSSFVRCSRNPGFYSFMLQRFRAEAPEFMKQCAATDERRCLHMLQISTDTILQASFSGTENGHEVQQLARVYANLGWTLDDAVVKHWLNALIYAVRCCDVTCNDLVLVVWRRNFMAGVEILRGYLPEQDSRYALSEVAAL